MSSIYPSSKTSCPVEHPDAFYRGLSFATVGRSDSTSPPYQTGDMIPVHRYYDPLRLPDVHLGFLRSSLVTQYLECFLLFVAFCQFADSLLSGKLLNNARTYCSPGLSLSSGGFSKETSGSPEFPDYPCEHMTWSQTPVVPHQLAISSMRLLPSHASSRSAFIPFFFRDLS